MSKNPTELTMATRRRVTSENRPNPVDMFRLIVSLFRGYPRRSTAAVALLIAANLSESIGIVTLLPVLASLSGEKMAGTAPIVDALNDWLAAAGLAPSLFTYMGIVIGGMLLKGMLSFFASIVLGNTAALLMTDLRVRLIRALMNARWAYFVRQSVGQLANMLGHEARVAATTFQGGIKFIAEALQVLIYVVLALAVSWPVTVGAVAFGFVLMLIMRSLVRMTHAASTDSVINLRRLVAHFADGLSSMKPIKSMALESRLMPILEENARQVGHAQRREVLSMALFQSVQEPLIAVFLGVGMVIVVSGLALPLAEVLFMAVLFQRTVTRIGAIQGTYQGMVGAQVTYNALVSATKDAAKVAEMFVGTKRPEEFSNIRLDEVNFSHGEEPILKNVSICAPAGQVTAIIGPSGAGKTTIVDLIIGLNRANNGSVTIGDTRIDDIDISWWRSRIGYVPQDTVLFNDTIFRNVTLGDAALTRAMAMQALEAAGIASFIESLPQGLDTNVGEHGNRLSGGQRQRLAIARALVRKPALLIFDEATSSLDPNTEAGILETLRALAGSVTIIAISHQPALLDAADFVYRIDEGKIVKLERNPNVAAIEA